MIFIIITSQNDKPAGNGWCEALPIVAHTASFPQVLDEQTSDRQIKGEKMALKYTLVRECLDNVEDNAGRWQIEGGRVMQRDKHVANYSSVKRVSCGTH